MPGLTGYIQRRSGSLTPDEQRKELIKYGVGKGLKYDPIYDELDQVLYPGVIREGYRLVVWELGIIGLANIDKAFVGVGGLGGEGIYSIKAKKFYPCHEEADKKHQAVRREITKFNSKVRNDSTENKGGAPKKDAWQDAGHIKYLAEKGKRPDDLAKEYEVSRSTIDRIIKS